MTYRPWGPAEWVLSLSSTKQWSFIGTIGTEERSLVSWSHLRSLGVIASEVFAEIADVDSDRYRDATRAALERRRLEYVSIGGDLRQIIPFELMAELFQIRYLASLIEKSGSSIVLDITSFPKRFFFTILRVLLSSARVQNLVLTYTSPACYADDGEPLYEDIDIWRVLPGFGGFSTSQEQWIVSVGFMVESLCSYIGDSVNEKMSILVPFPAPLAVLRRTMASVARLERGHTNDRFDRYRVETLDISAAFDRICSLAGTPEKPLAFAPFGPKPTAAAMCIYAVQKGSSVHYAQPTVYHPDYSKGIKDDDPASAVNAYWIKHEGENLYIV